MKKMQKNNKGFSLVELIVVILIMAIIAVALAPQVMKWVDTSRKNADINNQATLKSAIDAAVADYMGENGALSDIEFTVSKDGISGIDTTGGLGAKVAYVLNGQNLEVKQYENGKFVVEVDSSGSVSVSVSSGT